MEWVILSSLDQTSQQRAAQHEIKEWSKRHNAFWFTTFGGYVRNMRLTFWLNRYETPDLNMEAMLQQTLEVLKREGILSVPVINRLESIEMRKHWVSGESSMGIILETEDSIYTQFVGRGMRQPRG